MPKYRRYAPRSAVHARSRHKSIMPTRAKKRRAIPVRCPQPRAPGPRLPVESRPANVPGGARGPAASRRTHRTANQQLEVLGAVGGASRCSPRRSSRRPGARRVAPTRWSVPASSRKSGAPDRLRAARPRPPCTRHAVRRGRDPRSAAARRASCWRSARTHRSTRTSPLPRNARGRRRECRAVRRTPVAPEIHGASRSTRFPSP